ATVAAAPAPAIGRKTSLGSDPIDAERTLTASPQEKESVGGRPSISAATRFLNRALLRRFLLGGSFPGLGFHRLPGGFLGALFRLLGPSRLRHTHSGRSGSPRGYLRDLNRRLPRLSACFFGLIRDLFFKLLPFLAGAFFLFFAVVRGEFLSVVFEVARV